MFKFFGHTQFLEICATSKEIVLLHNNGLVLVVVTSHPLTALASMLWLTEKINVYPDWFLILYELSAIFICFSLLALSVMNFDRYLATHHPIFHRKSVTKGRLLILFAFLVIIGITVMAMSVNDLVISYQVGLLIFGVIFITPMLFINNKLFTVARKSRKNNKISLDGKKIIFEECIKLLADSCLSNDFSYSSFGLYCTKTNFEREKDTSR